MEILIQCTAESYDNLNYQFEIWQMDLGIPSKLTAEETKKLELLKEQFRKRQGEQINPADYGQIANIIKYKTGTEVDVQDVKRMLREIHIAEQFDNRTKVDQIPRTANHNKLNNGDQNIITNKPIFRIFAYSEDAQVKSEILKTPQQKPENIGLTSSFQIPISGQKINYGSQPSLIKPLLQEKKTSLTAIFKSKRKVKPKETAQGQRQMSLQQRFQNLQNLYQDCQQGVDKKGRTKNPKDYINMCQSGLWLYNEHFYSNYDRPFYKQSDMTSILKDLSKAQHIKYSQLKILHRALGKPKMFNEDLINEQIQNLNNSRKIVRHLVRQRQICDQKYNDIVELTANRSVIALHPICGHLHSGSILAIYKENQHVVKFTKPQLGTQKVLDIYISSQLTGNKNPNEKYQHAAYNNQYEDIVDNLDHQLMAITIKMLQYKKMLVKKLAEYNNKAAQIHQNGGKREDQFLEQYGWLRTTINIISMALRHIITKFRLRGLANQNQQQVSKNFTTLLLNPLHIFAKDLENSPQVGDNNTSVQIRRMIKQQKQATILENVETLYQKNKEVLSENITKFQQERMEKLLKSCLGILANLKIDGRDFDLSSNKYLSCLAENIGQQNTENFNQIYDKLHRIVKKMKELS